MAKMTLEMTRLLFPILTWNLNLYSLKLDGLNRGRKIPLDKISW